MDLDRLLCDNTEVAPLGKSARGAPITFGFGSGATIEMPVRCPIAAMARPLKGRDEVRSGR